MSLMGLITGGFSDIAKADQERKAMNQANETARLAAAQQQANYEKEKTYAERLNEPFYNLALPGFLQYASAVTGQPITADQYQYNPSYSKLSGSDLDKYLASNATKTMVKPVTGSSFPTQNYYTDAQGNIVMGTPQSYTFNPQDNPAYQWQQNQLEKQMNRQLRAMGRQNSTYGMNAMNDAYSELNAKEYNSQLGRLADLSNIARGGASTLTNTMSNYTSGVNQNINSAAQNQANYQLALGALKSRGFGEFDAGLGQAAGIVGSLYGGGVIGKKGA